MKQRPEFTQLAVSADARPTSPGEKRLLWVFGLTFCGLLGGAMLQEYVPQKLSIVFFIVFWTIMLVVHELGHAGMAKLLGWHVGRISIGFGPELWSGRMGQTKISLRLIPVEGYVLPAPASARGARWKSALIYAAGPGAELIILALLIAWLGADTVFSDSPSAGAVALKTLAIVIIWGAGFNLLPFSVNGGASDGLGILLSPFMTRETIERRLLTLDELDVEAMAARGETDKALGMLEKMRTRGLALEQLEHRRITILAAANRYAEAREAMDKLLDGKSVVDINDINLLHLEALVEMQSPSDSVLTTDLALNRALRLAPDNPSLNITRGIVDILHGHPIRGGNRIADFYRSAQEPYDRIRALGFLYAAATLCHDSPSAERFRAAFEHLNQDKPLAAAVSRAIGALPVTG